jgi:sensor domain CHASE-containing protein
MGYVPKNRLKQRIKAVFNTIFRALDNQINQRLFTLNTYLRHWMPKLFFLKWFVVQFYR